MFRACIGSRQESNIISFLEICFIFEYELIPKSFTNANTIMIDSHLDDIAFPWIIECIHICLLLAGRSHWWWHMSVVTLQMCRHLRTFTSSYLIFIILGKSLCKMLTSLLPGFVDSLQMVSLPKRSRLKSFSSRRSLDYCGLHFGECLCIHCSSTGLVVKSFFACKGRTWV